MPRATRATCARSARTSRWCGTAPARSAILVALRAVAAEKTNYRVKSQPEFYSGWIT
ncbi:exported hypothetical protein [Agrobacterium deltaense NCPPB 1641]|uniref:Uncharacterized protein n=1 Tax=Agrobacterium deltaense NCPPB 1641 TaxID=1183425 RepID=A0A1S7TK79_9HYPH|nr:exported hypothetical protein [Agrobacterium deltaense NCPPB 1641]